MVDMEKVLETVVVAADKSRKLKKKDDTKAESKETSNVTGKSSKFLSQVYSRKVRGTANLNLCLFSLHHMHSEKVSGTANLILCLFS